MDPFMGEPRRTGQYRAAPAWGARRQYAAGGIEANPTPGAWRTTASHEAAHTPA